MLVVIRVVLDVGVLRIAPPLAWKLFTPLILGKGIVQFVEFGFSEFPYSKRVWPIAIFRWCVDISTAGIAKAKCIDNGCKSPASYNFLHT